MDPRTELQPVAAPPVRKVGLRRPTAAVSTPAADTGLASAPPPSPPAAAPPAAPARRPVLEATRDAALWLRDIGLGASGYLLLVVVAGAGFTASFLGLHSFGMTRMGLSEHQAWLVPVAIDGADIGLSVTALRAAMAGRSAALNRLMIFACTAISSWINFEHISDWYGRLIAALLPILAVILLEFLLGEARAAYERRIRGARPRLSMLRWVFDRTGTLAILRAYVLGMPLPDQMAEAAKTIQTEPAAKPKTKRQQQRPSSQPKPKATAGDLRVPAPPQLGSGNADVIDIELVRKYGDKSARAITLWLNSIEAGEELSLRKIDGLIQANGTAKFAIKKYIAEYGDPRKQAVNE